MTTRTITAAAVAILALTGCQATHDPRRPIRSTVAPATATLTAPVPPSYTRWVACKVEDGGPVLPCRWDCRTMGNRLCGPDAPRVTLWVRATGDCPAAMPGDTVCRVVD